MAGACHDHPRLRHASLLLLLLLFLSFFCVAWSSGSSSSPTGASATKRDGSGGSNGGGAPGAAARLPTYVYAFGDSNTDTGNSPISDPRDDGDVLRPPFGATWPGEAAGRRCDGRLVIDWLCLRAFGGSMLPPYLGGGREGGSARSPRGENYAVSGSAALDPRTLEEVAGLTSSTPDWLGVQAGWFETSAGYSESSESESESEEGGGGGGGGGGGSAATTLVFFGENGGNDVHFALREGRPEAFIREQLLPRVVAEMEEQAARIVAAAGRRRPRAAPAPVTQVLVQGQFPMGCLPAYVLARRADPGSTPADFDDLGCVASVNALSDLQNDLIRSRLLPGLLRRFPDLGLVFLDTSAAFRHVLSRPRAFGFSHLLDSFCFDAARRSLCFDPAAHVAWDSVHMTDAMNGALVRLFLHGALQASLDDDGGGGGGGGNANANANATTVVGFTDPFPSFLTALADA